MVKWVNTFLSFGQQKVAVNGVKSEWAPVVSSMRFLPVKCNRMQLTKQRTNRIQAVLRVKC